MDNFEEAKDYMSKREIPQLFESLMTGLMYNKPADHIQFLETCLDRAKKEEKIKWNTFLGPLPPIPQKDKPIKSESVAQELKDDNQVDHYPEEESGFPKVQQPLPPIAKSPPVLQEDVEHPNGDVISTPDEESVKPEATCKDQLVLETAGEGKTEEKNDNDDNNNEIEPENQNNTEIEQDEIPSLEVDLTNENASEDSITQPVIFVLGGPGSGKGTQCAKIVEQFKLIHLSAGELLRAEMNKAEGSEYGPLIQECIKEGALVPQEITIQLLKNAMLAHKDAKGFLVDGFPREIGQGMEFEEKVCKSAALLTFSCDDDVLVARLLERGKTSGRTDDNEDTIKLRLKTFHEKTEPVLEHYMEKVTDIDASRTVEEIYKDVEKFMEHLLGFNELSEQIDSLMAEMKENPIKHEAEEEKTERSGTANQYPEIEDEIIPSEAFLSGDKGNVDQCSDMMINETNFGDEKDSAGDAFSGIPPDHDAESRLIEEDGVVAVEVCLDGDLGNVDHDVKVETSEKRIIYVIGPLDSEMTELCSRLAGKLGFEHISISKELIRDSAGSPEIAENKIGNPINKLKEAILASDPSKPGFIIEGLPQDVKQGVLLEVEIKSCDLLVHLESPTHDKRQNEAEGSTEEVTSVIAEERVLESQREMALVANHFEAQGKLAVVSSLGSREEVFAKLLQAVEERLVPSTSPAMSKELEHANIIFVLGGPGSGKGTQCAKIVEKYGFCHLSTGDLLREEVNSGSERAKKLKDIMERGELVSQEIILQLLKDAMVKRKDCKGFLIDGFPRDVPQGDLFEKTVGTCKFVLYFDCSNEVMVERLLGRAKTSGRVDDNEETIKKRLKTFEEQTLPVLEKYGPQDKVRKVNAERGVDDIFADVCSAIDKM